MTRFLPSATKLQRLCFYTCLSIHRGEYLGRYPREAPRKPTPPPQETADAADGMHPTGMHSCLRNLVVYEEIYLEVYINNQYIGVKNDTTQLWGWKKYFGDG